MGYGDQQDRVPDAERRGVGADVTGLLVSGNYFGVLGLDMARGSPILAGDDRTPGSGGARGLVAVLSDQFWKERLNGDVGVVGRAIRVNGQPATIVGIAPPGFHGTATGSSPSVFLP